jgi:hypothetical protein
VGGLGGVILLLTLARPKPQPVPPAYPPPGYGASGYGPPPQPQSYTTGLSLVSPTGYRFVLRVGTNAVGRIPGLDILLDDPQVSRRHAEIQWDGTHCTLVDLGSHNGTFVNGVRLLPNTPAPLRAGARVTFGTASVWTVTMG